MSYVLAQAQLRDLAPAMIGVVAVAVLFVVVFAFGTGWIGRVGLQDEDEELEPVVAGIGVGSASVPKWLYAVYLIVPLWAVVYLVNNTKVRSDSVAVRTAAPTATAAPAGSPAARDATGGTVTVVARNIQFDLKTFSLEANAEAVIEFRNRDAGIPHNVAIARDKEFTQPVFSGKVFPGPATQTYTFTAPGPGAYYFRCDVHPAMNGTVTVA